MARAAGKTAKKTAKKAPATKAAASAVMTGRSQKWMEAVTASLERDTGKTLEQWVRIAKTCPETAPRKRAAWLKDKYGLGVNRAAQIFSAAFPAGPTWDQPDALLDLLWKDKSARAIYDAVAKMVRAEFPEAIIGPRKTFVSFSRNIQFAGIIPAKDGKAEMGFPLPSSASKRLQPMKRGRPWAEKHTGLLVLSSPKEVDAEVKRLLKLSWEKAG
jgi:hypothetical protein